MKRTTLILILLSMFVVSCLLLTACHSCEFAEWTVEKPATCTQIGQEKRVCECGAFEIRDILATGHTEVIDSAIAPDCTETGLTQGKHCSVCNEVLVPQQTINVTGHDEIKHDAKYPTCTAIGWHAYVTCSRCDYTTYHEIPATGHADGAWITDIESTCTEEGSKHQVCATCGETIRTEVITTLKPHNYINGFCSCGAEQYTTSLIFELNSDGKSYTVTGISSFENDIIIPANYNGKPVTSVGYEAFNEKSIQSVTFGSNITTIEPWAFRGCKNLTVVNLPEKLTIIKEGAFAGCEYIDEVIMHDNVKTIEKMAFYQCKRMVRITLSQNLTTIGEGAFNENYCLSSITLPNTLKTIGKLAFSGCSTLSSLSFPNSLNTIDEYAFADCAFLKSITFGTGDLTIGARSFMECVQLTKVYIPKNVQYIDVQAFAYCTSLQEVIIIKGVQSIGSAAFQGCTGIRHMELPFIGHSATQDQYIGWIFGICSWYMYNADYVPSSLQTIDFTGLSIPTNAMYGCSGITISYRCPSDRHTTIVDAYKAPTCTEYGKTEGSHCSTCGKIFVEQQSIDKIDHIDNGNGYCESCNNLLAKQQELDAEEKRHNEAVALYTSEISRYQTLAQNAKKSYGISSVGEEAGYYRYLVNECDTLIKNLNNSIAHYRLQEEMYGYDRSSQIADCYDKIDYQKDRKSLYQKYLTIAEYQDKVAHYQNLLNEENESYNTKIQEINAKYYCLLNGCTIVVDESVSETCMSTGLTEGTHCSVCKTVYVEQQVIEARHIYENGICKFCGERQPSAGLGYVLNANGNSYSISNIGTCVDTIISIPATYLDKPITKIQGQAFQNNSKITMVIIPETIQSIGEKAFYNCSNLSSIVFNNTQLSSISANAFLNCNKLKRVEFNNSIEKWCAIQFEIASNPLCNGAELYINGLLLENLSLPSSFERINSYAFHGCTSLKQITLPDNVWIIGTYAFANCVNLSTIDISDSSYLSTIQSYAFSNCSSLKSIVLPQFMGSIGAYAFNNCTSLTNVYFTDVYYWYIEKNDYYYEKVSVYSSIRDSQTAARMLKSTYVKYNWSYSSYQM